MPGIALTVNGQACTVEADDDQMPLLDLLREDLQLKGTRFGCGEGSCGACAVLVDGVAQTSCNLPLWAAAGKEVTTVEALDARLRAAFVAEQAAQCAYCSSGMLVAAAGLLRRKARPTAPDVVAALDDHLCRCGAHPRIVRAVLRAAAAIAS